MLAIGMDVHSSMSTAFAVPLDVSNEIEKEFCEEFNRTFTKFPSTRTGMRKVSDFLEKKDHCILIENSTKTHELYWIMDEVGLSVMVAYSTDLFRITKSVKKTDAHDSQELAHYMRRRLMGENEFSECLIVDRVWMNRRQLCRLYAQESEMLSDTRRQLRSYMLLRGINPKMITRDVASLTSLAVLERGADESLAILVSRARDMQARLNLCRKAIKKEFERDENYLILMTIPGFGEVISGYISAMVVNIDRFDNSSQFAAYIGIVPKQRESADSAPSCGITRHGDQVARDMIKQATHVHIVNDKSRSSPITKKYDSLRARGFPHKKALTAAANKMSRLVFSMLKNRKDYKI